MVAATPALAVSLIAGKRSAWSAAAEERYDFNKIPEGWEVVSGKWVVEDIAGASANGRALVQRATNNEFNVIVATRDRTLISTSLYASSRYQAAKMRRAALFSDFLMVATM